MSEGPHPTGEQLADAAIGVLADAGIPALTHPAVEARARAAAGAVADAFGDQPAFLQAVVDRIVAHDAALWTSLGPLAAPQTIDELAERFGRFAQIQGSSGADTVRARMQLAAAHPEVAATGHLSLVEMTSVMLDRLGVPEPGVRAGLLVAFVDGVVIHHATVCRGEPVATDALVRAIRRVLG